MNSEAIRNLIKGSKICAEGKRLCFDLLRQVGYIEKECKMKPGQIWGKGSLEKNYRFMILTSHDPDMVGYVTLRDSNGIIPNPSGSNSWLSKDEADNYAGCLISESYSEWLKASKP